MPHDCIVIRGLSEGDMDKSHFAFKVTILSVPSIEGQSKGHGPNRLINHMLIQGRIQGEGGPGGPPNCIIKRGENVACVRIKTPRFST